MKKKWINNVSLKGSLVTLRILSQSDKNDLIDAAKDGNLWELSYTSVPSIENTQNYIATALNQFSNHQCFPFAVVNNANNKVIGTTRYINLDTVNKRLEIGFTWYAKSFQRTGVNRECKYLLLRYAFEQMACIAVEFRTHHLNTRSRDAISKLGAKYDGTLRNHQIDRSGGIRHTIVYSITREEWPNVKLRLEKNLL